MSITISTIGSVESISLWLSISTTLALSISIPGIAIAMTIANGLCRNSIESISLWLSISITLSISIMGIAKTVSMAIAQRRVSKMTISMTKRINTVSKTISSIRMVESVSISLGLTLGNMDNTSRVGNISSSTSIGTMDSRDSSRGNTTDTYSVGNIGNTISVVDRDSMDSMVDRGKMMGSIANMSYTIAKMMTSNAIQSISISSSKSCSTSQ